MGYLCSSIRSLSRVVLPVTGKCIYARNLRRFNGRNCRGWLRSLPRSAAMMTLESRTIPTPADSTACEPYKNESAFRRRGAAGELAERGVTYILKVGDADFAGVEAVGGEIAQ